MILDVCSALAALLEPDLDRVVLDTEPLVWEKERLYVYPLRVNEETFETGPTRLQRFDVNAVYVTDSTDEVRLERDPALAALLDEKRGQYMSVARQNSRSTVWEHLTAMADDASPRGLDKRSAAVRITGWRLVN